MVFPQSGRLFRKTQVVFGPCIQTHSLSCDFLVPPETSPCYDPVETVAVGWVSVSGLVLAHTWGDLMSTGSKFFPEEPGAINIHNSG